VLLSTHIVEDVAQTCQHAAVMAAGRVVYTGTVSDLVRVGEGATWEVVTGVGSPPPAGVVVSAISRTDGTHYRVISSTRPSADAVPTAPSLEDGYVALMQRGTASAVAAGEQGSDLRS
jgi:ABC-2 type transport system ATP-binding protein